VRAARERAGVHVIYSDTSALSSLNMIRALRHNEIVALQLDRSPGAAGARQIPFFGAPASFPSGPFVLARVSGAPLIPVFIPRVGRRHYAIRMGDRFNIPRDARRFEQVMAEVIHFFEDTVRSFPSQWFQFAPFWSDGTEQQQQGAPQPQCGPAARGTAPSDRRRAVASTR